MYCLQLIQFGVYCSSCSLFGEEQSSHKQDRVKPTYRHGLIMEAQKKNIGSCIIDSLVYTHNMNLTSILISNILHLLASISVKWKLV